MFDLEEYLVQAVPDLIENSLCNVNKVKRLKLFTDAVPHTI